MTDNITDPPPQEPFWTQQSPQERLNSNHFIVVIEFHPQKSLTNYGDLEIIEALEDELKPLAKFDRFFIAEKQGPPGCAEATEGLEELTKKEPSKKMKNMMKLPGLPPYHGPTHCYKVITLYVSGNKKMNVAQIVQKDICFKLALNGFAVNYSILKRRWHGARGWEQFKAEATQDTWIRFYELQEQPVRYWKLMGYGFEVLQVDQVIEDLAGVSHEKQDISKFEPATASRIKREDPLPPSQLSQEKCPLLATQMQIETHQAQRIDIGRDSMTETKTLSQSCYLSPDGSKTVISTNLFIKKSSEKKSTDIALINSIQTPDQNKVIGSAVIHFGTDSDEKKKDDKE